MTTPILFVAWQDPEGRAIIPVGRLTRQARGYRFEYIRGALRAHDRGFLGFVEFPQFAAHYTSDSLFPLFQNRLMPTARPDYVEHVQALGIDPADADPMGVLARSGGTRATDRVELFAPPSFIADKQRWESYFLLRGVRHRPRSAQQRILELKPQERLYVMLDFQNEHNARALLLRTEDGHAIGHLPDYMVEDIAQLVDMPGQIEVRVEQVNPPPTPVHHRVLGRLVARWNPGFHPFSGTDYTSLADASEAHLLDAKIMGVTSAAE